MYGGGRVKNFYQEGGGYFCSDCGRPSQTDVCRVVNSDLFWKPPKDLPDPAAVSPRRRDGAILGERSGHSCIVNYSCLWLIRCGIFFFGRLHTDSPWPQYQFILWSFFSFLKSWHSLYSKRFGSRCAIHVSFLLFDPVLGLWYNCFLRPPAVALISLWRLNCRKSPPLDSRHNHIPYK